MTPLVRANFPPAVPQPTVHRGWIEERAESVDLSGCATW
jgi:hypothetical protein